MSSSVYMFNTALSASFIRVVIFYRRMHRNRLVAGLRAPQSVRMSKIKNGGLDQYGKV